MIACKSAACIGLAAGALLLATACGDDQNARQPETSTSGGSQSPSDPDQGDPDDPDASCQDEFVSLAAVPSHLVLVVDRSGSMACNAPSLDPDCDAPVAVDPDEPTRWDLLGEAVLGDGGFLEGLEARRAERLGLVSFPTDDDCGVPAVGPLQVPLAAPSSDLRTQLETVWQATPKGRGPLSGVMLRTLESLRLDLHAGDLPVAPTLVLLTDGGESCQSSAVEELRAGVSEASRAYGMRTHVVGLPGSGSARALLSELAVLGGTAGGTCDTESQDPDPACHVDLAESSDPAPDLASALSAIAQAENLCTFEVPERFEGPDDLGSVHLTTEPSLQLEERDESADCGDDHGFYFTELERRLVLCPRTCERWQSEPSTEVTVSTGCGGGE